jgi:hypothetical protein
MDINYFSFIPFFETKSTLKPRIVSNTDDAHYVILKSKECHVGIIPKRILYATNYKVIGITLRISR